MNHKWYQLKGDFNDTRHDPPLLIIGQSFGLFFNVLASFLLLFHINGFETMIFTTTCICSLAIATLLDFLCLLIFGVTHPNSKPDGYILSTAYYLTLASAIMSFIAVLLMTIDAVRLARMPQKRAKLLTPQPNNLPI